MKKEEEKKNFNGKPIKHTVVKEMYVVLYILKHIQTHSFIYDTKRRLFLSDEEWVYIYILLFTSLHIKCIKKYICALYFSWFIYLRTTAVFFFN